jgi:hypothetical protein
MAGEIIVPGAAWRPFSGKSKTALVADLFCFHTEVGTNEGSISYGAQAGNPYAHLYLACNGYYAQCKDLRYTAAANLEGNPYTISLESEDINSRCFAAWNRQCGHVPAWTTAQVTALINIGTWCAKRFGIPPFIVPDTCRGRRGFMYHRQGIDPYRKSGCLKHSASTGKCCPDLKRINQIPFIMDEIRKRVLVTPPPPGIGAAELLLLLD